MKKYFLLINVIVGFSCTPTTEEHQVIPSELMVELLVDIHILEARVDKLRIGNDSSYAVYNTLEKELFEKHGVSKKEYVNSYKYYLSDPNALDRIYEVVVDSLNVIQKRGYQYAEELADAESLEELNAVDSLARLNVEKSEPILDKAAKPEVEKIESKPEAVGVDRERPATQKKLQLNDSVIQKKRRLRRAQSKSDSIN